MNILRYAAAKSCHSFTSRAGLTVPGARDPGHRRPAGRRQGFPAVRRCLLLPGGGDQRLPQARCGLRDPREGWSDAQIVWRYSQRADASENSMGSSATASAERTCPAAGPEGQTGQPGPARGSTLADVHLPAALIPRPLRTRQQPAGNDHEFARPEFAAGPGTRPAPAFRHGNRPRFRLNPGLQRIKKFLFLDF